MNKEMAAFFDKLAPDWDNSPADYDKREKIVSLMRLPPGSIIADIGCGKGVMFEHLLKTNPAKIIAVDVSGEMLKAAQALYSDNAGRIEYIHDDFLDISLPMLDAAVIFNAYPHFLDKKALAEKLSRVIKPNGTVIIAHSMGKSTINGRHTGDRVSVLSVPLEEAAVEAGRFQPFFTPDTLIDDDEIYFIKLLRV